MKDKGGIIPTLERQINMERIVAKLIKNNKVINELHDIKSVVPDKKHGYFEITQKICTHDIITIHRFSDTDRVELYKHDKNYARLEKVPYKVVKYE